MFAFVIVVNCNAQERNITERQLNTERVTIGFILPGLKDFLV
jgi:hypothetical protein